MNKKWENTNYLTRHSEGRYGGSSVHFRWGDSKTTDYVGNMIYENGALKRILIDGGYIEGGQYYYYLTDHLGNNRVVANANGVVVQKNHYYPFGMAFAETPVAEQGKQPYKFGGKELDQMNGLNLYDVSARFYDPALPNTLTPDRHCENYYPLSPYSWCANNPMNYIDRTGCDTTYANLNGDIYGTLPGGENIVVVSEPLPEVTVTGQKPESGSSKAMKGTLAITGALITDDAVGGELDDAAIPFVLLGGAIITDALLLYEEFNSPSPPTLTYPQTDNPSQETPHYKDDVKKKSSADSDYGKNGAEHVSGKTPSKRNDHENGRARNNRDRGGEKGDVRRTRYK